jgi:hypothetical protein
MFVVEQGAVASALNLVWATLVKKSRLPIHTHALMDLRDGRVRCSCGVP